MKQNPYISAKQEAITLIENLLGRVRDMPANLENSYLFRHAGKSSEAIYESLLNEGSTQDSYCASDLGWFPQQWPLKTKLQNGEEITRVSKNYEVGPDQELVSVTYHGNNKRKIEIFND